MREAVLLIGGSYGIGKAIVELIDQDYEVFVASRTKEGLEGMNVNHIPFDVLSDTLDISSLPSVIKGFVFCPGSINLKPFKMLNITTFEEDMNLNFFSLVRVVKEVIGLMSENSSMVFFSTVAVGKGMPFHSSVAASKGAVEGFVKSIAAEYAPKIRANIIAPSLTDTPLAGRLLNNDRKKEAMSQRHPLQRYGEAEDSAHMAAFLLSKKSSWITGQVFGVDGGISSLNL
ncbi:SDR family NAD(P)-dependent oxidoreductase [Eudoraea chungangensis]|uniref:SDR family NAD(P)-dependent oxidoreductase n=1 Tax=Eudoraea chungangensis TaxID=1481905 RepID=UPI0023EC5FD6|nr:SDR family oxidoreductase [Eudoraea chungangensis]